MRWGQRKGNHSTNILTLTRKGPTWNDKLKQQQRRERHGDGGINGNTSSTNMKRDRYQTDAKYRATVDRQRIKKAADGIKKLKTAMSSDTVKKSASKSAKQIINNRKRQEKGKEIVRKLLDPSEYINKDGYYK